MIMGMNKNDFSLGELIRSFGQQPKYKERLYLAKIREFWRHNMGRTLSEGVQKIYLTDRKVVFVVQSSTLKHELLMSRDSILKKVNDVVEEDYFTEVVIR